MSSSLRVVGGGVGRHDEGRGGQPVEGGEAAVQVAAAVRRRALVAEQLPHERLVVELDDRGRLEELEERRALGLRERLELGVGSAPNEPEPSSAAMPSSICRATPSSLPASTSIWRTTFS